MSTILPVQAGSLPAGFCPSSWQEALNGFSAEQTVTIPSGSGLTVVASATQPADTTVLWLQLDSLGKAVRIYYFGSGAWLSQHPLPPGMTMLWTTALPVLTTFDGGDANPISVISGPMWEVVTAFAARVPVGVGTLPSGLAIAVGDTGGAEKVTLDATNSPEHTHWIMQSVTADGSAVNVNAGNYASRCFDDGADNVERYRVKGLATEADSGLTNAVGGDATGVAVPHDNMPPWLGVYCLRRTQRTHYAIT